MEKNGAVKGKVITVRGPVEPEELGRVMMHEHLHSDLYDWEKEKSITEEKPISRRRRELLMKEAVPVLKRCNEYGGHGFLDPTPAPFRAWPTVYVEASEAANQHIVLCTGFYREIRMGTFFVKKPEDQIWPFVREASVEELADFCIREITDGIHGTEVRAGAIKVGSSSAEMTEAEKKAFQAAARAQKATGVHITTHSPDTESQAKFLAREGVDLRRVVIGHAGCQLRDPHQREKCMEWMKRGATFLPTGLAIKDNAEAWQDFIDAIHTVFDAGLGHKIVFGMDWAFTSESGTFGPCAYLPGPPFLHLYTHTLPAFRKLGLLEEEIDTIMRVNPREILPVQ